MRSPCGSTSGVPQRKAPAKPRKEKSNDRHSGARGWRPLYLAPARYTGASDLRALALPSVTSCKPNFYVPAGSCAARCISVSPDRKWSSTSL
ncbi:hypothetical protein XENOCAPTIV_018595 [Xenoophorus captivus]|uniref:Uncharacterized protein n=1 Tax=Xenoophorus captivus TaxID=1517983 RepID=A0ABV0QBM1_9TELE